MKKRLLTLVAFCSLAITMNAQYLTDGGFEGQFSTPNPSYPQIFTLGDWRGYLGAVDTQNPPEGSQSLKLTTTDDASFAAAIGQTSSSKVSGVAWYIFTGDIPNVEAITSASYKAKYETSGNDFYAVTINFYDTLGVGNQDDLLLYGGGSGAYASGWTDGSVDIIKNPANDGTANLMLIVFYSSYSSPTQPGTLTAGTNLWIDDFKLNIDANWGLSELKRQISIFPNPAEDALNVKLDRGISTVTILTTEGKELSTQSFNDEKASVEISDLSAGMYLYKVIAVDGSIYTSSFVKK